MLEEYFGRRVSRFKADIPADLPSAIEILPTIKVASRGIWCNRCGARLNKEQASLPNQQYYCPFCLNLGRVDTLSKFYHVHEPNQFSPPYPRLSWHGQLSPLQAQISQQVVQSMRQHERRLIWAVTGAGKTEMMFQGLADALSRGERLAWASPRVDVCLEIFPRLQSAFKDCQIALLHGRQDEPYHYRQLTVCTTHQLLRFYQAFDNLIIDEVDAFPFAANPRLIFAAKNAIKPTGGILLLTATPGRQLLRLVKARQLAVSYLPLRYHGHLLPQIRIILTLDWRRQLKQHRLPARLLKILRQEISRRQRFLLFVPHVKDLAVLQSVLRHYLPNVNFTTVHASDPQRLEKVQAMREEKYLFLITTSILERGVTFPAIDVLVLGADDEVFSTSALVQIAGRAGRSAQYPDGQVIFFVNALNRRIHEAQRQVAYLNQKGRKLLAQMPNLRRDD